MDVRNRPPLALHPNYNAHARFFFAMHTDYASLHIADDDLKLGVHVFWCQDTMPIYSRSKTCNRLFTSELSRRLRAFEWGSCIRSNAVHPGTVATGLNTSLRTSWYLSALEALVYAIAAVCKTSSVTILTNLNLETLRSRALLEP